MSPCTINVLTPDGLLPANYSADSLADAVQYEPHDGVYTTTNTFNTTQVLKLEAHLDRLEDSARRENILLQLDRLTLRKALRQMIEQADYGSVRYRITVPRENPSSLILSIEPFHGFPPEIYANGVRCITVPGSARQNPSAKTTGWMHDRDQVNLPEGIFTGLLLDFEGKILEGMSSNFYAILNGELRTAGEGVLPGIAQQIIFEIAPPILPVKRQAVCVDDIPHFGEAFISGSTRGIVPVVEIDGIRLGDGQPGPKTRELREAYAVWLKAHLEEL